MWCPQNPLVQIYLLGRKAEGPYARPFGGGGGLFPPPPGGGAGGSGGLDSLPNMSKALGGGGSPVAE